MEETLISFETAKLAKEVKFDLYTQNSYWNGELTRDTPGYPLENGITSQDNYWNFERYYAPTQSLLQKWLRETHNIHISIDTNWSLENIGFIFYIKSNIKDVEMSERFNTYEEAFEEGLFEALKLINNGGKIKE